MADSAVAITAGTGTSVDTRTEGTNGHHRQVVVLGDPATNAGVAPVDATAGLKVDLGSDNDITGTVDLGATDNAVLDAIESDTTTIAGDTTTIAGDTTSIDGKIPALGQALAAASVPVVLTAAQITTLTPPSAITGFATSAKQDTIIGHVDGIEGLLTTIDGDTGTIATEVAGLLTDTELRATPVPVSGTVTANLGATDNAVLDDIAADTEAIKTSLAGTLTVTGGGGGVEYTEGDTDASITGSAIMWEDTGDTLRAVSAAKPLPISDAGGALTVDGTVAVTNAGITTIAGAVSGTEMQVDVLTMPTTTVTATDLDVRPLVNTDVVTAELSAVDNAVLDTIDAVLDTINAKLVTGTDIGDVTINNASGASAVNIQDGGNTITVDGTVAVTNAGITTIAGAVSGTEMQVDVLTMPTVTVTATNLDVQSGGADLATSAQGAAIQTAVEIIDNAIAGSEMQVDVVGALPAGTNAIGKLAANSGVDIGDVDVTSVSGTVTTKGIPSDIDINGSNANHADKYYTNVGAVTDGIVWSPAAGKRWHVLTLYINVSAAATVTLEDDLAGGDVARWKGELAANSGVILKYDKEHPFCSGEDAADLIITTSAGNVYVQAVGYEV